MYTSILVQHFNPSKKPADLFRNNVQYTLPDFGGCGYFDLREPRRARHCCSRQCCRSLPTQKKNMLVLKLSCYMLGKISRKSLHKRSVCIATKWHAFRCHKTAFIPGHKRSMHTLLPQNGHLYSLHMRKKGNHPLARKLHVCTV